MNKTMGTATCVSSVRYRLYIVIFMMDLDNYQFDGISVAIIDDHEVVLEGFRSYMVKKGLREVEAFSRAQPLLDRIHSHPFSVYVVDVEMPGTDGVQLIDSIRAIDPEARIIVNTIHEEAWVVNEMTEKGVEGVIYKSAELEVLLQAIVKVAHGGTYFSRQFKKTRERIRLHNSELLTKRENEVLQEIAKGYSTKEISAKLFISENTVETHRQRLFAKLKATNMAQLVIKAIAAGYINPQEISAETEGK